MRKADIIVAIGLMVLGLLALGDAVRLGFGWGMSGPEAGFFPFYMGLGIVICTFFIVAERPSRPHKKDGTRENPWSPKEAPLRSSGYCFLPSG